MKKIWTLLFAAVLFGAVALSTGCRAEECRKMTKCCAAIEGEEGVGGACGDLAQGVKDPETCRTILKTVEAMYDRREEELPAACQ